MSMSRSLRVSASSLRARAVSSLRALAVACASLTAAAPLEACAHASGLHEQVGDYQVEVLVDGVPVPSYEHRGDTWVLGQNGDRYTLRVSNRSARRIEAVVSVDGRDVMDGRPGDLQRRRGYLVPAWGTVEIDGWRVSSQQAAAFRFSSVAQSYAAQVGSARDVGVIGVAIFPERLPPPPPRRVYVPRDEDRPTSQYGDGHGYGGVGGGGSGRIGGSAGEGALGLRGEAMPAPAPSARKAAPSALADAAAEPRGRSGAYYEEAEAQRPGLGTEFGEAVESQVHQVSFVRASAAHPSVVLGVRYNDRNGLLAMGIPVDRHLCGLREEHLRRTAEPFPGMERRYATPPPGWR